MLKKGSSQPRSLKKETAKDPVLTALARHKLMTHAELAKVGASGTKLRRMADAGLLSPLGTGIYASASLDPFVAAVLATAKYYPQAIISGLTALQLHGLAQEYIEKIDVDVSRETSIRNKMLQVHRVPEARLVGVTQMKYEGGTIRVYSQERSLCEAYRLDPAGPLFFKALKRYVARGKIDSEAIQKFDQAAKTSVLGHLRQELADV